MSNMLEQVAEAVLYEGHILYPYRATAKKNQQRFTFGRVYPECFCAAEHGLEPCLMQTECLVTKTDANSHLEVSVRFLQVTSREIGLLCEPLAQWSENIEPQFRVVPELRLGDNLFQTWQEAVERVIRVPPITFQGDSQKKTETQFRFATTRTLEPLQEPGGPIVGVICRRQETLTGMVETELTALDSELTRVTIRIRNQTEMLPTELSQRQVVELRTFASTHTLLRASGAEFVSLMAPPTRLKEVAARCQNIGTWPVLVGDEQADERHAVLSSPIILYDYPKIAPESAGPLFDGTEIDELLTLRILTMTDEEKREMRHLETQTRKLLERAEGMPHEQLMKMHGTWREPQSTGNDFFGTNNRLEGVTVEGVYLRAGDRVRLRPKGRADVFDLALAGQTAVIQAVEQDLESRVHLAVVLDADPGRDLGMMRQTGHRFFYGVHEVEPLDTDER